LLDRERRGSAADEWNFGPLREKYAEADALLDRIGV